MGLKSAGSFRRFVHVGSMKAIMKLEELTTAEHFPHFLQGTQAVAFFREQRQGQALSLVTERSADRLLSGWETAHPLTAMESEAKAGSPQ